MKKILLNVLAGILLACGVYRALALFVLLLTSFQTLLAQPVYMIGLTYSIVEIALLIITGAGLLRRKNWSITLYWIAFVILPILQITFLPFILGVHLSLTSILLQLSGPLGYILLFNVVVAMLLSRQWGKLAEAESVPEARNP